MLWPISLISHSVPVEGVFPGLGLIQSLFCDGHYLLKSVPMSCFPWPPGITPHNHHFHREAHQGPQAPHLPAPSSASPSLEEADSAAACP